MLVLTRKQGERIRIGEGICITVLSIDGTRVRLGLAAPEDVPILRGELTSHADATGRPCEETPR